MPGSIRVARVAGIPIGIHPLWFAVVALITWSLGAAYYPEVIDGIAPLAAYALGLASALLLFASVLLHELGHALVARRYGIRIDEIDLWLLGGVAVMRDGARRPGEELRFALAGPAVTVVVAIVSGALALLLAGVGIYGVTAYAVTLRRTEIGIRMALGATSAGVLRLIVGRTALLLAVGVAVGAVASAWAGRFVGTLLYELEPRDPPTLIGAALVLAIIGTLAAWLPARRAARIDPAQVLREG